MNVNFRSQPPVQVRKQADKANNLSFKAINVFFNDEFFAEGNCTAKTCPTDMLKPLRSNKAGSVVLFNDESFTKDAKDCPTKVCPRDILEALTPEGTEIRYAGTYSPEDANIKYKNVPNPNLNSGDVYMAKLPQKIKGKKREQLENDLSAKLNFTPGCSAIIIPDANFYDSIKTIKPINSKYNYKIGSFNKYL